MKQPKKPARHRAEEHAVPPHTTLPGVPDVESPFFEAIFDAKPGPEAWRRVADDLNRDGFAVIDFPEDNLDAYGAAIKQALNDEYCWDAWHARQRMPDGGMRVQEAWQDVDAVKAIAVNAEILALLEYCYGRKAIPFQTLNFPVGTQQHYHSDTVHFSSIPERFMCGVWVSLEDIGADNGPLVYYPGSHKLPCLGNEHIGYDFTGSGAGQKHYHAAWDALIEAHGLEQREFHAQKGQALIWSANLLHGGQRHRDRTKTRWSQVTHYYFEDCFYYCPMSSDMALGRAKMRKPYDIRTGKPIPNRYLGRDVDPRYTAMLVDNANRGFEGHPPDFGLGRAAVRSLRNWWSGLWSKS